MDKFLRHFGSLDVSGIESDDTKYLLHGNLEITINELKFDNFSSTFWANLNDIRGGCHVKVELPPVSVGETLPQECHKGKVVWKETLRVYCANRVSALVLKLKGHGYKGKAEIWACDISDNKHVNNWFIVHEDSKVHGRIHVTLDYVPANEDPLWGSGIGDPDIFQGVPNTYFPLHKGCRVTPFQNSHVEDDFLPPLALPGDRQYRPGKYWEELHQAILEAKHFVYIAGWSMFAEIALIRGSDGESVGESLDTLLIRRANEGISVLIMIWDDRTNNLDGLLSKEGMMHTHDEDTHKSFNGTKVKVFRCPRDPKIGAFHLVDGFVFTHHQKAVVLDAPEVDDHRASNGLMRRRVVSYVGGIDLCGGRFDTPSHSLFRTLKTVHRQDFHQESLPGANLEQGGPRQPWHDIHSKLEGAVAWDVFTNFKERWEFQGKRDFPEPLVDVTNSKLFCPPTPALHELDPSAWNVQLFRSIDSTSVGFPFDKDSVQQKGLLREHLHVVDRSIQDAYICAIRRAKRFLFIENQYFMGSSFAWKDEPSWRHCIPNLVPIEIALKIASKIRAGERFSAYIIVPMAPNGAPVSQSVQDLLHHQRKSIEMMYTIIREALEEQDRFDEYPTDFLQFFCLGKREAETDDEYIPKSRPPSGSQYERAQQNRRFPIYVHAKLMIVDDEYLIIGSANINQRAMDGARDTEMAMGAFQPLFTMHNSLDKDLPFGEVYAFRMSLWYEHLGLFDPLFDKPWELECMKKVQLLADQNWAEYIRPGPARDLKRHLLSYPVLVTRDGRRIYTEPGQEKFPDTDASILGAVHPMLPALLTA